FFDNEWQPGMSGVALTPLDSELGIDWPIGLNPNNLDQVSEKDAKAPTLKTILDLQTKEA
ncbi:MAG: dTDP-4-dehydrorhamnose 3,5-epimerase, partial [Lactococcus sp.]|nr:dTDP-4-dehydrorhamnose 3,5-epimerase [Lactococcus sp.]